MSSERPAYHEIGDRVREAILNGKLPPGTRLPSAQELSRLQGESVGTIQAALSPLVKEGLIERRQKHGTFVRNRGEALGGIGLYFGIQRHQGSDFAFQNELQHEILDELKRRGSTAKLWVDHRSIEEQRVALPEIQEAIERREVQGLILGVSNLVSQKCLMGFKIPTSFLGSSDYPGKVQTRFSDVFSLGFQELRSKGCKSVGIITNLSLNVLLEKQDSESVFFEELVENAKLNGLSLKSQWNRMSLNGIDHPEVENQGYVQLKSIWAQSNRPEGLIVFPDVMARGVIMGILERGISVPSDLKLVMHRNEGIPYLNPFPTSYIVSSARQRALMLIEQLCLLIEGKKAPPAYHSMILERC